MPRFRFVFLTLGIVGTCVVALVHAQDRTFQPANAGAPAAFAEDTQVRPIGAASSNANSRSTPTSNRRRGNLADRIKAARRTEPASNSQSPPREPANFGPATQSISDDAMPTLADPPLAPPVSEPALGEGSPIETEAADGQSPALLAPDLAEPPASDDASIDGALIDGGEFPRSAALPSVLKRSPDAWRSADSQPEVADEQAEPNDDFPSESSPSDTSLTEEPAISEIGSGRADDTADATAKAANSPPPTARRARAVSASSEFPSLRVQTIGPAAVRLGKEAIWQVELENTGASAANDVTVSIHLPTTVEVVSAEATVGEAGDRADAAGGAILTWTVPQLAGRAKLHLEIRAIPKSPGSFELRADWTCRPTSVSAQVEVQEPKLDVAITGPAEVKFGDKQIYTVVFSNPGTGDAENVQVTLSPLTAGERAPKPSNLGTIPAGAKKQVQIELVARQAGIMEIKLRAAAEGGLEAEGSRQVKVKRAQLQVVVRGPKLHYAGAPATYRVAVSNVGDAAAEEATVSANLPPGAKPVGKSPSLSWQVGDLAPGVERVFEFACEFSTGGECAVAALAEAAGNLTAAGEMMTQVEAIADLKLSVNDPRGAQPVGEDAVYEVTIVNRGARAAQQVEVLAQFSDGIEPTAAAGAGAEIVTGQVIFKPIAEIAPGETISLKVTARAEQAGNHIFRTEVRCADPETKLVSESTTRYFGESAASP